MLYLEGNITFRKTEKTCLTHIRAKRNVTIQSFDDDCNFNNVVLCKCEMKIDKPIFHNSYEQQQTLHLLW